MRRLDSLISKFLSVLLTYGLQKKIFLRSAEQYKIHMNKHSLCVYTAVSAALDLHSALLPILSLPQPAKNQPWVWKWEWGRERIEVIWDRGLGWGGAWRGTLGWVRDGCKTGVGPDGATWLWVHWHSELQPQILWRGCDHSKIKHDWFLYKADGGGKMETVNPEREAEFVMWGRNSRKQSLCERSSLVGRWQLEGRVRAGVWLESPVSTKKDQRKRHIENKLWGRGLHFI